MLPDSPHKSRHPALPDLKVPKLLQQVKSIGMGSITNFSLSNTCASRQRHLPTQAVVLADALLTAVKIKMP